MIGFNYLGKMGQLGNQMFQYASLRGIAKNRGFDFCIPYHNEVFDDGIGNKLRIELFDPFVMKNLTQSNIGIIGLGRNGEKIAKILLKFNAKLSYFDKQKIKSKNTKT